MNQNRAVLGALALASLATLLFEMVQIRIFSYTLTPILAYTGISLAMTGFGIGAMLLSLFPSLGRSDLMRSLVVLGLLQAASMVMSGWAVAATSWNVILNFEEKLWPLLAYILIPSMLPYLFSGIYLALLFEAFTQKIGKLYFWNLVGSGLGCVLIVLLLTPLGAQRIILASSVIACVSSMLLALFTRARIWVPTAGALAVFGVGFYLAPSMFDFEPDPFDTIGYNIRRADLEGDPRPTREFSQWNIVGKVDVWNLKVERVEIPEKLDLRMLAVDAGATTQLVEHPEGVAWDDYGDELFEETCYGIAYSVLDKPPQHTLVIGAGGGIDVHTALHWNSEKVTAVEINSSTIHATTDVYGEFVDWPQLDEVDVVHADGRNYIKNRRDEFDVIQMSGVDTMTVYATGSITMAEDYLYTVDAFIDYYKALTDRGVLSVLRFGQDHVKLSAIATEALLRLGIENPGAHIAAYKQNEAAGVLVRKTPFTENELDRLTAYTSRKEPNEVRIPHFEKWGFFINAPIHLAYAPDRRTDMGFARYFQFARSSPEKLEELNEEHGIAIPTDDNPYYMLDDWLRAEEHPMKFAQAFSVMKTFWVAIIVMAFVFILLPVIVARRRSVPWRPLMWILPYFFGIGLCFMLIEICVIQQFTIFVGSPGASLAVVLAAILVSSGIGAYTTGKISMSPKNGIRLAFGFLVFFGSGLIIGAHVLFGWLWTIDASAALRGLLSGLAIAPTGFALGWFFPLGLRALDSHFTQRNLVPWAVSVNGFASVLGSVAALPLSLLWGFESVFWFGLVGYAGVFSTTWLLPRR